MHVSEIMTRDVFRATPDMTLREAAKLMKERDVGALPVGTGDGVLGMITDRDIICRAVAEGRDAATTTVGEIMSGNPATCREEQDVDAAAHLMEERQIRRLPVLDEANHMVGILGIGDISQRASHELSGEVMEAVTHHS